jgi:hypothetical protein
MESYANKLERALRLMRKPSLGMKRRRIASAESRIGCFLNAALLWHSRQASLDAVLDRGRQRPKVMEVPKSNKL